MARLNIEEDLHKDNRFINLIIKLGCRRKALGALVEAWMLDQKYYLTTANDRLIPLNEWERQNIENAIIDVGLAYKRDGGIQMAGADKQFKWLLQRQNAGAASKLKKKGTTVKRPLAAVQRTETSSLSSLSSSLSSLTPNSENVSPSAHSSGELPTLARIWNENCGTLPKVKACSSQRTRKAISLWRLHPDEEYWVRVTRTLAESKFCTGANDRGWIASFDFLLQPDTHNKALEGKYSNSGSRRSILDILQESEHEPR